MTIATSTPAIRGILEQRLDEHSDELYAALDALTVGAWGLPGDGESTQDRWAMSVQDRVSEAAKEAALSTIEEALRDVPANVVAAASDTLRADIEAPR